MKQLSLYGIRDLALDSGRSVFSVQQLASLLGKSRAVATVYCSRLVGKGLAVRLLKGKIALENDAFVIASQLVEPSYVSLNSALLFHGIIQQVPKLVECVSPKNSLRFKELGIVYHKIPASLFFGFKKHSKGKSYVLVAEPEKALIDGLYLGLFSKKDAIELGAKMDSQKLLGFASSFKGWGSKKILRVLKND